jgi:hypothetical protein
VTSAHWVCDQSALDCLETIAGVIQVGTQWLLFSVMCVNIPRATTCRLNWPFQPHSLHSLLSASSQICHIRHRGRRIASLRTSQDEPQVRHLASFYNTIVDSLHSFVCLSSTRNLAVTHSSVSEPQSILYLCYLHTAAVFAQRPFGRCSIAA